MTNPQRPARHPAALLMQVRALHTYVGLLIAPTVLFMALTGILQVYSLHEAHPGYTPPPLIEKLGRLHKDQVFAEGRHRPLPAARPASAQPPGPPEEHRAKLSTTLLKAFLALAAAGLVASTSMGIWMALRDPGRRRLHGLILLVGVVLPTLLAVFST